MKTVAVINYKGGVGKTTLTMNLAAGLVQRGYKTLVIDVDPQCSLTFSFIPPDKWVKEVEAKKTIRNFFDKIALQEQPTPLHDVVIERELPNRVGSAYLISSHLGLINVDLNLATLLTGNPAQYRNSYLKTLTELRKHIKSDHFSDFDFVLIDCPPNFNIVTKSSIVASDYILVPTKADYLSTMGIDYLEKSINELVSEYNGFVEANKNDYNLISPRLMGVVFTMIQYIRQQPIQAQQRFIQDIKNKGNVNVFDSMVRENKTSYSDEPYIEGPVILRRASTDVERTLVGELNRVVDEFLAKV